MGTMTEKPEPVVMPTMPSPELDSKEPTGKALEQSFHPVEIFTKKPQFLDGMYTDNDWRGQIEIDTSTVSMGHVNLKPRKYAIGVGTWKKRQRVYATIGQRKVYYIESVVIREGKTVVTWRDVRPKGKNSKYVWTKIPSLDTPRASVDSIPKLEDDSQHLDVVPLVDDNSDDSLRTRNGSPQPRFKFSKRANSPPLKVETEAPKEELKASAVEFKPRGLSVDISAPQTPKKPRKRPSLMNLASESMLSPTAGDFEPMLTKKPPMMKRKLSHEAGEFKPKVGTVSVVSSKPVLGKTCSMPVVRVKPILRTSLSVEAGEFVPSYVKKQKEEARGYDPRDEVQGFQNFQGSPAELLAYASTGAVPQVTYGNAVAEFRSQSMPAPKGRRPRMIQESDPMVAFLFRHLRNNGPRGY